MNERFGAAWSDYRRHVRRWNLRWRPWRDPAQPKAALYFDGDCKQCRKLAEFLTAASHLELALGDRALARMTYDPRDGGATETGIAALARALEHLHLGWAFIGWSLRVPFLRPLFQLIADAVTAAPKEVCRAARVRHLERA